MDLSQLVGHEIIIFSEELQEKSITNKVIMASDKTLSLDRGGSSGLINRLTNDQKVSVQFDYKGQRMSVEANFKRSEGGRCTISLEHQAVPLTRRRFRRFTCSLPVRCAVVPNPALAIDRLQQLRWMQTDSLNISSGGIQIMLPTLISADTYMFLNIPVEDFDFPSLMIGQVRYSHPMDNFNYCVGIEFITSEQRDKHFSRTILERLPRVVFQFTQSKRSQLDKKISARMQQSTGDSNG
jgi:hypothetical protein